ncbi:MAG: aldehyde dehydrogenase family protein, partial [Gammaproteobacteria bacterium]|nr:aldehyde dehydrogenase family protein [Gammaproteobacteria bacterium]
MNTKLLIGGRLVSGEGPADPVLDAATAAELASVPAATVSQVEEAVRAAETAFAGWGRTSPRERAQALLRIAEEIEA